jgi:hypothetical protein
MRQQVRRLKKGGFPHRCRDLNQQIPALGTDYTIECPQDPVLEPFFRSPSGGFNIIIGSERFGIGSKTTSRNIP